MLQYTIKRLLLAIPTLLGISLLSFLIMHMAPGDPVDLFLGGGSGGAGGEGISTDRRADADRTREELRRQLGLDKPLHIQYLNWLSNIVLRVEDLDGFERGALMADSGAAANLWPYAVMCFVFVRNRLPSMLMTDQRSSALGRMTGLKHHADGLRRS